MNKLIVKALINILIESHFVKIIRHNRFSVMTPYTENLEAIASQYNLKLVETFKHQFDVQGVFELTDTTIKTISL